MSNELKKVEENITKLKKEYHSIWDEKRQELNNKIMIIQINIRNKQKDLNRIDSEISDLKSFKLEVEKNLSLFSFKDKARTLLQALPHIYCPSCRQELSKKPEEDRCPLCNQQQLLKMNTIEDDKRETIYLVETLKDVEYELDHFEEEMKIIEKELRIYEEEEHALSKILDGYYNIELTKRIDVYKNLIDEKSWLEEQINQNHFYLKMWDQNKVLKQKIQSFNERLKIVEYSLKERKDELTVESKLKKFAKNYKRFLEIFPDVFGEISTVTLELKGKNAYLPRINGEIYNENVGGGALILAIQLYYLVMLNMFLRGIAKFPPLLIFDTPRQQELRSDAYQKLIQLSNKISQNSQIIICVSEDIPLDRSQYNLIEILNGEYILG